MSLFVLPDAAAVALWADLVLDVDEVSLMGDVLAAIGGVLARDYSLPYLVDVDGVQIVPAELSDGDLAVVVQAVKMQAARLFKRRTTIEGVTSFGVDFAIRVNRFDPDIDALLDPWRNWGFA